jgi:hypothetical protein
MVQALSIHKSYKHHLIQRQILKLQLKMLWTSQRHEKVNDLREFLLKEIQEKTHLEKESSLISWVACTYAW